MRLWTTRPILHTHVRKSSVQLPIAECKVEQNGTKWNAEEKKNKIDLCPFIGAFKHWTNVGSSLTAHVERSPVRVQTIFTRFRYAYTISDLHTDNSK